MLGLPSNPTQREPNLVNLSCYVNKGLGINELHLRRLIYSARSGQELDLRDYRVQAENQHAQKNL